MPGFELIGNEEFQSVKHVFDHGGILFRHSFDHLRNGTYMVRDFEEAFARRMQSPRALAVTSGTAALRVALAALNVKEGDEVVGNETRVKVVKNKIAPPFKQAEFIIKYGEGISKHGELIDLGVKHKLIDKAGAWYSVDGERIGQGKDNAREHLKEHSDMSQRLEEKIREKLMSGDHDESDAGE